MIFVFDLDGTLSDTTHRMHYIRSGRPKWREFFEGIPDDPPFHAMIELIRKVAGHNTVVFQTGRPEQYRQSTIDWLAEQGITPDMFSALLMRADNDHRKNIDLKLSFVEYIMDKYMTQFVLWFEDSEVVVEMVNKQGILALSAKYFTGFHPFQADKYEIPGTD